MVELAKLFERLGVEDALNLDGGGSSIMVARQVDGSLAVLNSPSDGHPRPVAERPRGHLRRRCRRLRADSAAPEPRTSATVVIGAKHSICGSAPCPGDHQAGSVLVTCTSVRRRRSRSPPRRRTAPARRGRRSWRRRPGSASTMSSVSNWAVNSCTAASSPSGTATSDIAPPAAVSVMHLDQLEVDLVGRSRPASSASAPRVGEPGCRRRRVVVGDRRRPPRPRSRRRARRRAGAWAGLIREGVA